MQTVGRDMKTRFRMRPFFSCAILILQSACLHRSRGGDVQVRVRPDTVDIRRDANAVTMKLSSVIRNSAAHELFYQPCGAYLQRLVEEAWATVWTPICVGAGTPTRIAPHDSATVDLEILAFFSRNSGGAVRLPVVDPRMTPGRYRVVVPVGRTAASSGIGIDQQLPLAQRASEPFEVR